MGIEEARRFISRCKAQNWWGSYVKHLEAYRHVSPEVFLRSLANPQDDFVGLAFYWVDTDEGDVFWQRVQEQAKGWIIY